MSWHQSVNEFLDPFWALVMGVACGGIFGGAIGWAITWWYARKSSSELRSQIAKLEAQVALAPRMLDAQAKGQKVTLNYNNEGQATGLVHHASIVDSIVTRATIVSGTIVQSEQPTDLSKD